MILNNLLKLKFNLTDQKPQISSYLEGNTEKKSKLEQLTSKMLGFSPSAAASCSTGSVSGTEELSITQQPDQNQQSLEEMPVWYLGDLGFPSTASAAVPACSQSATQLVLLLKRKGKKSHLAGRLAW